MNHLLWAKNLFQKLNWILVQLIVFLINQKELEFGAAILDLGSEKISFGIFKNLALVHSITFPIGINHITKDISKVCSLNLDESENIRNNIDFLFQNSQKIFDEND